MNKVIKCHECDGQNIETLWYAVDIGYGYKCNDCKIVVDIIKTV